VRGDAFLMRRRSSCFQIVSDLSWAVWSFYCLNIAVHLDIFFCLSKAVVSVGSFQLEADGCI
jgi:hypothetical protein